ncbi:MAG: retroviral-like aspartic protease family protein [Pseudolabrys sp.]
MCRFRGRHWRVPGCPARVVRRVGGHSYESPRLHGYCSHRQRQDKGRARDRIEVGGITVYDVPAMVLPDEVLSKNLLGVSFLSRLRRYEYANGRLLLEQ